MHVQHTRARGADGVEHGRTLLLRLWGRRAGLLKAQQAAQLQV